MPKTESRPTEQAKWDLRRWENGVLLLILAILFLLHLLLQMNADAFWRDEVSSILLAQAPSWKAVWAGLVTDSFPILWVIVLRGWNFLGMGAGEWWLRLLGMVISAGVIAALFAAARRLRIGTPVLATALVGAVPAMFYWGDSLRAYGLACVLIALLFGWVWSFVESGAVGVGLAGAGIAILAVHSNYQNSYLIFGVCVAGAIVAALNRHWVRAAAVLGMGAGAAVSMFPYSGVIAKYQAAAPIQRASQITLRLVWNRFADGYEGVTWTVLPMIVVLVCVLILVAVWALIQRGRFGADSTLDKRVYAAAAVLISALSCYGFINYQGFPTNCWYYLPILTVAILAVETTFSTFVDDRRIRLARLVIAALVFLSALPALWIHANLRRTTMDMAAFRIAKEANEHDFVMVHPFFESISFSYYYKGSAPWSLLPVVKDEQRMDGMIAVTELMAKDDPLEATYAKISETLRNGGRVYVLNGLNFLPKGAETPKMQRVSPSANGPAGWIGWSMEVAAFFQKHAKSGTVRYIQSELPVCKFENIQMIFVFEGWKD